MQRSQWAPVLYLPPKKTAVEWCGTRTIHIQPWTHLLERLKQDKSESASILCMQGFMSIITSKDAGDDGRKEKKNTGETEYLFKNVVKSLEFFGDRHHNINARHCCFITQVYNGLHFEERNNTLLCLAKFWPKSQLCMCLYLEK